MTTCGQRIRRHKSLKRKKNILEKGNDMNASMKPKCIVEVEYVVHIGYSLGFFLLNVGIWQGNM